MDALIYVIILEVLHQIESNFIYPKIVGNSVGLPGLWVFAAVIVGGSLMGGYWHVDWRTFGGNMLQIAYD